MLEVKKIGEETLVTKAFEVKREEITYVLTQTVEVPQLNQKFSITIRPKGIEFCYGIFLHNYAGGSYETIKDDMFEVFSVNEFCLNTESLYFYNHSSNTFFDSKMQPEIKIYDLGYIAGIKQKSSEDTVFLELFDLFKEHPYISNCSKENIPYYNANFSGQEYIKMSVTVPKKEMLKMYEYYSTKEHVSVRVSETVEGKSWAEYNLYGEEIENKLLEHNKITQEYRETYD